MGFKKKKIRRELPTPRFMCTYMHNCVIKRKNKFKRIREWQVADTVQTQENCKILSQNKTSNTQSPEEIEHLCRYYWMTTCEIKGSKVWNIYVNIHTYIYTYM